MKDCNNCFFNSMCEKAKHVENYKIIGGCDKHISAENTVEVVRCKDCKYFDSSYATTFCVLKGSEEDERDYCSSGERRAEE